MQPKRFIFGEYQLDAEGRSLTRAGVPVPLAPKTLDLLLMLVESDGRLISKTELMKSLWRDTFVEEASLAFQISTLRKALGDEGAQWIVTVPKHGYRFTAEVKDAGTSPESNTTNRTKRQSRWLWVSTALLIVFATGLWRVTRTSAPPLQPEMVRLTSEGGLATDPAISPDGRLLAYASDRTGNGGMDIWVRPIGGESLRVTTDAADDLEPAFSPDGSQIAYRSERDGGGVYVVPALGGESRLLAKYGRRPRFSPNGSWVAYWVGFALDGHMSGQGTGRVYIVPTTGGTPMPVQPDFASARYPVWSPDGEWLLFTGSRTPDLVSLGDSPYSVQWYVTPLAGGTAHDTNAIEEIKRARLSPPVAARQIVPGEWRDGRVVFAARFGDTTNLWDLELAPGNRNMAGPPRRLTFGADIQLQPTIASARRGDTGTTVVFASVSSAMSIWSLAAPTGKMPTSIAPRLLSEDATVHSAAEVSPNGENLIFVTNRSGAKEFWIRNLVTGHERPLIVKPQADRPRFSGDGSEVAYAVDTPDSPVYITNLAAGTERKLCQKCGNFWDGSSNWRWALYVVLADRTYLELLDTSSGERRKFLADDRFHLYEPAFSPDDKWVQFLTRSATDHLQIFIVPFRAGAPVARSDWIAASDGQAWDDEVRWSADGARLYFISDRDGFHCLWGQDLDAVTKERVGSPFAVYHAHGAKLSLRNVAVSRERIWISQREFKGNIWMTKPQAR
jgi:Tol biopolymer transport system component/DNA-binding winged helix-turn-helix (wHTH) protein